MCIWNTPVEDRRCEYCTYNGCHPEKESAEECAARYAGLLFEIVGRDVLDRSRDTIVVWARYMIAYKMREKGFSTIVIGKCLGLDHSTVIHGCKRVKEMLKYPVFYQNEMNIWSKFVNSQKQ